MDADSRYAMLYAMGDETFDVRGSEETLSLLFAELPLMPLVTRNAECFWLRRQLDMGMVKPKVYRVFADRESSLYGESALASFRVRGPVIGRATVERADVDPSHRHRRIAARVYDVIEEDMMLVGAELWPSAPGSMSDDGFRLWWSRRPSLVVYYPHRERLNLPLTLEQYPALDKLEDMDRMLLKLRRARSSKSIWPKVIAAANVWVRGRFGRA